jgi:hypothetical protein
LDPASDYWIELVTRANPQGVRNCHISGLSASREVAAGCADTGVTCVIATHRVVHLIFDIMKASLRPARNHLGCER